MSLNRQERVRFRDTLFILTEKKKETVDKDVGQFVDFVVGR